MPPYERPINMMFQSYALFPHLTVWENIAFGLKREGLPRARDRARGPPCSSWCSWASSPSASRTSCRAASSSAWRWRAAWPSEPKLLLLDEPLGALDKKLREQTQIELVNIIEKVGVTCVMVTHDQEEAMTMASRIAVMSEGRFLQVGAPGEIYETPATRFVADFIGNVNLMDGTLAVDEPDHVVIAAPTASTTWATASPAPRACRDGGAAAREDPPQPHKPAGDDFNTRAGTMKEMSYFGASPSTSCSWPAARC
jgi:putrescine transport system ATP-binding protein